jgi:hypothetical protein
MGHANALVKGLASGVAAGGLSAGGYIPNPNPVALTIATMTFFEIPKDAVHTQTSNTANLFAVEIPLCAIIDGKSRPFWEKKG